jgi:hypothetical protein
MNNFSQQKTLYIIIGIVLVLVVLVGAVSWGIMNKRANLTPEEVTRNFLRGWAQTASNSGGSPLDEGLHRKSTYVTDSFARSVEQNAARHDGEVFDPVFCNAAPTQDVSVGIARISESPERTRASITAEAHTDGSPSQALDIVLVKDDDGWWRIDEIDCTTPIPLPNIG